MVKGFTKIDNQVYKSFLSYDLTCTELKVLLAIIRYTSGFGRKECKLSADYIARIIGKSRRSVTYAIDTLCGENIILKLKGQKGETNSYIVNYPVQWSACKEIPNPCEEDCKGDVKKVADYKDKLNKNNKYNSKNSKSRIPTPKATAFNNMTTPVRDYRELEMRALRRRLGKEEK